MAPNCPFAVWFAVRFAVRFAVWLAVWFAVWCVCVAVIFLGTPLATCLV